MKSSYDTNGATKLPSKHVSNAPDEVSTFRRILPQILASTIKNFLLLDLGLSVAFPTIVIPALTGNANSYNADEYLRMTPSEASWFASIAYICQPAGSILSGWISEPLGRKRAMFLVNIPHFIAWIMMYNASTIGEVFAANVMLGLGVGLMEAPIITYVGEISEPSIRGILISCASIAATLGFFIIFLMGSLMPWRTAALACLTIPVTTMIAVCFVPETPLWLLSKNRTEDALKSLQWLRGWVSPKGVEHEFKSLQRYNERSNSCNVCIKQNVKCPHPAPTIMDKMRELTRKRTLKPFLLVMSIFLLSQFTGILAMRPYTVQILKAYGIPLDANWATVIVGLVGLFGNIILLCIIRLTGKRQIYLFSLAVTFISCFVLSVYGFIHLPAGWSSFVNHNTTVFNSTDQPDVPRFNSTDQPESLTVTEVPFHNYIPLFVFIMLNFATSLGVASLPWMLLSEVFPFKARGFATGLAAAFNYFLAFVATKTYYNLESVLSMPGVTLLYCIIGVLGFIAMYLVLPETENRTLEDIEIHFSDNSKKITDRHILQHSTTKHSKSEEAATVPTKPISMISDMIEMKSTECNGHDVPGNGFNGTSKSINNNGCDNYAFAMDR